MQGWFISGGVIFKAVNLESRLDLVVSEVLSIVIVKLLREWRFSPIIISVNLRILTNVEFDGLIFIRIGKLEWSDAHQSGLDLCLYQWF